MKNWPHTKGTEDLPAERRGRGEGGQSEQLRTWEGAGEAAPEGPQTRLKYSAGAKDEPPRRAGRDRALPTTRRRPGEKAGGPAHAPHSIHGSHGTSTPA